MRDAWVVIVGNFATGVDAVIGPFFSKEEIWFPELKTVLVKKVEYDCEKDAEAPWTPLSRVDLRFNQDHKLGHVFRGCDKACGARRWSDDLYYLTPPEKYVG